MNEGAGGGAAAAVDNLRMPGEGAGLYVHVPFCISKCLYCDFNSYVKHDGLVAQYLTAVDAEMRRCAAEPQTASARFKTIYIGGGTPSVLSAEALARLAQAARTTARLAGGEFSVEANPGTITPQKLEMLLAAGANRLSLGVQSLDAELLRTLGRAHSAQDALVAFAMARRAGFRNIGTDLMFALPGQTMAHWRDTVERVIDLRPEHISCYSLIIEEGTPFAASRAAGTLAAIDEELEAAMYEWVVDRLQQAGYAHYEISNFALPGFACEHNQIYWRNEWYLGLGPGAHSHWAGERFANEPRPARYAAALSAGRSPALERRRLSVDEQMDETLLMGLRLLSGVGEERFFARFGRRMSEVYERQIDRLLARGLVCFDGEILKLSARGLLLGNQVFAEFLR